MGWWDRDWYPRPKPRRPANGLKAKTGRGRKFGQTWWAGRWLDALERLVDPARLSRGRSYARTGQVLNLDIQPGRVNSRVQGSQRSPYKVRIEIKPLDDRQWDRVIGAMAAQAVFAAKLLAGEMPQNIEEAFAAAKVSLFPTQWPDMDTECSCPDWAKPCKHVAAVYYLLGEQFDEDPFLLFRLRGRTREQVVAALRARRSLGAPDRPTRKTAGRKRAEPAEAAATLAQSLSEFWTPAEDPGALRFNIARPQVAAAAIKQLGEPPFWQGRPDFLSRMSQACDLVSEAAVAIALGE